MKAVFAVFAAALTLTGCSSLTGPDDQEAARRAAVARRSLESATKVPEVSKKLSAN
jgi:PBP1b-binding outer membrane lipoprotein LpoB